MNTKRCQLAALIAAILMSFSALSCRSSPHEAASQPATAAHSPIIIHQVFFWLKPGLTPAQLALFRQRLETLAEIPSSHGIHIGTPIQPLSPVVDASYSFSICCLFHDQAEYDAYDKHPLHAEFLADCKSLWERVVVYDFVAKTLIKTPPALTSIR